jgi:AcrR family transcriptional regulator
MTSLRHNPVAEISPRDAYLDAARDCILDVGWRRTTLTEVARRAGVSRMTIYRTWSDMSELLGDLMTREWATVVEEVRESTGRTDDARVMLREGVVRLVQELRTNELFIRIVELDPELILPYLLERPGRSQEAVLAILVGIIGKGQRSGALRDGDPHVLARTIVLAAHGFVLSAQTMADDRVSLGDLDDELARLVERVVTP